MAQSDAGGLRALLAFPGKQQDQQQPSEGGCGVQKANASEDEKKETDKKQRRLFRNGFDDEPPAEGLLPPLFTALRRWTRPNRSHKGSLIEAIDTRESQRKRKSVQRKEFFDRHGRAAECVRQLHQSLHDFH